MQSSDFSWQFFFFTQFGLFSGGFVLGRTVKMIKTMIQQAKKHPGLIPQFIFTTLGMTGASLYLIRLAKGPHVTLWNKKNNPEPWNKLDPTYQYKFVAVNTDYKSLKKEGPDF